MTREELIVACTCDFSGVVRGKAFPADQWEKRLKRGVGWVPANAFLSCFGLIGESPFGSLGDLVLIPDPEARLRLALDGGDTAEHFVMGTIRHTDGRPWELCTRAILRHALQRLEDVAGLHLRGAFEHEFQFRDCAPRPQDAFALAGMRADRAFGERVVAAQRAAGITPDTFLREYGPGQFEVTMGPETGMRIADHAVFMREITRAVARQMDREVTFSPLRSPDGVGNGVHIHMGLVTPAGSPATWDRDGRHQLSQPAGAFVAGILKYLPAILALTAASRVSYLRLTPHRWSAAFNNLGLRDREASVRICPVSTLSDRSVAEQFHFEFRAADATASPYLQLAALVHAGVQGIEEGLEAPEATADDLSVLSEQDLADRSLVRLPTTLHEALDRLEAEPAVASWFPAGAITAFLANKRFELASVEALDDVSACALYETIY